MGSVKQNILIYRLGSLGDTIMALPVFHKVRNNFPDAHITLLTNHPVHSKAAPAESILGSGYFFNRVLNYPIGVRDPLILLRLMKEIRALDIDLMIYLTSARKQKTLRASKLAVLRDKWFFNAAGVKNIIGLPKEINDFESCPDLQTGRYEWEAKRLARRVLPLGEIALEKDEYWDLNFTKEELKAADDVMASCTAGKPVITISTGTKQPENDWGEDNWITMLRQLGELLPDHLLAITGAAEETDRAGRCLEAWGNEGINLCGKTSPRVSGAVFKKAALFIGHDSGPMHMAACGGIPCIAIFSARNLPGQWFPRGQRNEIIYHQTDCAG